MKTLVTLAHPSKVLLDSSKIVLPVYWRSHAVVQVEIVSDSFIHLFIHYQLTDFS